MHHIVNIDTRRKEVTYIMQIFFWLNMNRCIPKGGKGPHAHMLMWSNVCVCACIFSLSNYTGHRPSICIMGDMRDHWYIRMKAYENKIEMSIFEKKKRSFTLHIVSCSALASRNQLAMKISARENLIKLDTCLLCLDPCARVNCNHGRCEIDRGSAVCRCYQGYTGHDCLTPTGK